MERRKKFNSHLGMAATATAEDMKILGEKTDTLSLCSHGKQLKLQIANFLAF